MQVHPQIAALRSDGAPQRNAQVALGAAQKRWSETAPSRAILAQLQQYGRDHAALEDCPALAALFAPGGCEAGAWVGALVSTMVATLADNPLGHVGMRHSTQGATSTLLLGRAGDATLALVAVDGVVLARQAPSESISFAALDNHEVVLAGHADAELIRAQGVGEEMARIAVERIALAPGAVLTRHGGDCALRLIAVERCHVSLRLQRRARGGGMAFEHDLASGRLLHRSAGVMSESRHALMLNLLGRMGRRDAAPIMAQIAREPAGDDLRWQALREGLGLDTASGFAALGAVARDGHDPLAPAAQALRAQLLETYPALRAMA